MAKTESFFIPECLTQIEKAIRSEDWNFVAVSYDEVFASHATHCYRRLRRFLPGFDSDDIASEAKSIFLKNYNEWQFLDANDLQHLNAKLISWIRICVLRAGSKLKSTNSLVPLKSSSASQLRESDSADPVSMAVASETRLALETCVDELSSRDREIFEQLRAGNSRKQVSENHGLSTQYLGRLISDIISGLQRCLARYGV